MIKSYTLKTIIHNGSCVGVGATVELDEEQFKRLAELGHVESADEHEMRSQVDREIERFKAEADASAKELREKALGKKATKTEADKATKAEPAPKSKG